MTTIHRSCMNLVNILFMILKLTPVDLPDMEAGASMFYGHILLFFVIKIGW